MEPPSKPVLIYDGECRFCCHFVASWQRHTGERVQYAKRAEAQAWILDEFYQRSAGAVLLMMPDGRFFEGAEAVFRVRALGGLGLGLWLFQNLPGVRTVSAAFYGLIARHRLFFSRWLRAGLFVAGSAEEWTGVRWLFLRGLGLIYAVAFLSFALQIPGLIGEEGLFPAQAYLDAVWRNIGRESLWRVPTLGWLGASDGVLLVLGYGGFLVSLLLLAGLWPGWCLLLLWVFYLSLVNVGGDFFSFQWDMLLLEAGFLALLIAPWRRKNREEGEARPSLLGIWLFRLLIARFMFTCGLVKLASGDPDWANLTALEFHYFTQPLPTWIGWYAHQLSPGVQGLSALGMFGIELALPFFILLGRWGRVTAFVGFGALQVMILLTGNHAYFNWLTLVLCLTLLDDRVLAWFKLPVKNMGKLAHPAAGWALARNLVAGLLLLLTLWGGAARWLGAVPPPALWQKLNGGWHWVGGYGVFADMTTHRPELIVEGSDDGVIWKAYEFKYKPGVLDRRPVFIAPFQPRLDWQMWFVGVGTMRNANIPDWFVCFLRELLEGNAQVLGLLEHDPFGGKRPVYLRVKLYDYEFTNRDERERSGEWWKRRYRGLLVPELGLDRFR